MLKETDPAIRLPVCLFRLELVVVACQCLLKGCFVIVSATSEQGDCEQVPRNVVSVIIVCEF